MPQHRLQIHYRAQAADDSAGRRCLETLLNCYCRELAGPAGRLHLGAGFGQNDWPMALRARLQQSHGRVLQVLLFEPGARLLVVVESASATGNFRYLSPPYGKRPGQPWGLLDWRGLAQWLLRDLVLEQGVPFNIELLAQIRDSVAVTRAIVAAALAEPPDRFKRGFLDSEQSLVFGHAFHPAPKSRQGFSETDVERYSPELRVGFPLHYFAVRHQDLRQASLLQQSCASLVAGQAPAGLAPGDDFALLPTHPWQGRYLRNHPLIRRALRQGRVRDLGCQGPDYYPTSSIRTLFRPDNPYFYKCSLQVRITNCVRKNASYELDGALAVSRLLGEKLPDLARRFPAFRVLLEPAYMTLSLDASAASQQREVAEGFGLILRNSVAGLADPGVTPLLAAALFADNPHGGSNVERLLDGLATQRRQAYATVAEAWFEAYLERLLAPLLFCYFEWGVVFEPHLQNVLIGLRGDWPGQVFVRDFEGVKLVPDYLDGDFPGAVDERVRRGLCYTPDQGWNRIGYCLLVNHLCEAIAQISRRRPALEAALWAIVRTHLQAYLRRYGSGRSGSRIEALLAGQPLPCKGNLINRLLMRPDRQAGYLPLTNPLVAGGR